MQQSDTYKIEKFVSPNKKYNLTIVDKDPLHKNFVYRGLSEQAKLEVSSAFYDKSNCLRFVYDGAEAFIFKDNIHTIVFSQYMTEDDEEEESFYDSQDDDSAYSVSSSVAISSEIPSDLGDGDEL